jgi:uncharacterized protein YuzE
MKIEYDREVDALYVRIQEKFVAKTIEVDEGVNIDFDDGGKLIGLEILDVTERYALSDIFNISTENLFPENVGNRAPAAWLSADRGNEESNAGEFSDTICQHGARFADTPSCNLQLQEQGFYPQSPRMASAHLCKHYVQVSACDSPKGFFQVENLLSAIRAK